MRSARSLRTFGLAFLAVVAATSARADTYPRQPIDVLHYAFEITFAEDFAYTATARLHVRMRGEATSFWLDLDGPTVDAVAVNGRSLGFRHSGGRLALDLDRAYGSGEIVPVEVSYHGRPGEKGLLAGANAHGRRVLFAENWPDEARRWLPSVDHPSDKAGVDFAVTAPDRFDVVAPGRLVETRSLLDGRRLTRWSEAAPIPTYCMVIAVAEFDVAHTGATDGVPLSVWAYPPDAEAAARKLRRSGLMLEFFADLVAPFPYAKLAQVESPGGFGGMENAGAIFYAEKTLEDPSREEVVAHEIAHQWWGDSVTPADWDDLWLSEGFATYFEGLFYEHLGGRAALRARMTERAERIRKHLAQKPGAVVDPALVDPRAKLNEITYSKGSWALHMLRRRLGDEVFFRGLRGYYRTHAGGNTTTEDLRRAMEASSGVPLGGFFGQWLQRPDLPELRVEWAWDERAAEVVLDVEQVQSGEAYAVPVELAFQVAEGVERRTVELGHRRQRFTLRLPGRPEGLQVDPDTWLLHTATVSPR